VLSLAKLGRGREDYYLRSVGADASEYYSERGEVAGRWLGGGAAALGLRGLVHDQAVLAVLAGYEPGAQPRGAGWDGLRLVAPPKTGRRTPGFDACFKAPKSVSLLWAFGDRIQVGGRTLDRVVEMAHDEAVREALAYLEASAAKGRRGRDGVVQMDSTGFVAAVFRQRTSRAGDPHLHSHVLIANMCQGGDGRWGALDARLLYVYAKAAGYLYEAHLRYRLSSELGVDWAEVTNGIADVLGVPEELIDLFSKRSREIRGRLDEVTERINEDRDRLGLAPVEADSQEALDIAARETRAAKLQHVATSELRADWEEQATNAGCNVERLADVLNVADCEPPVEADAELHRRVSAVLTEHASTFGGRDAVQELAADARRGVPAAEVLERTAALLASQDVIPVVGGARPGRDQTRRRRRRASADRRATLVDAGDAGRRSAVGRHCHAASTRCGGGGAVRGPGGVAGRSEPCAHCGSKQVHLEGHLSATLTMTGRLNVHSVHGVPGFKSRRRRPAIERFSGYSLSADGTWAIVHWIRDRAHDAYRKLVIRESDGELLAWRDKKLSDRQRHRGRGDCHSCTTVEFTRDLSSVKFGLCPDCPDGFQGIHVHVREERDAAARMTGLRTSAVPWGRRPSITRRPS
jgi:conjugative relaxase-like TrwC/TraI family protein